MTERKKGQKSLLGSLDKKDRGRGKLGSSPKRRLYKDGR